MSAPSPRTRLALRTTEARLSNGLEVILLPDHAAPVVAVNLYYHVGSKDDPEGRSGFAHLFEHLMLQGSKHVPEDAFYRLLQDAGATEKNASTGADFTRYFETLPAHRLELALWLESDRMGFLLEHLNAASFDGQREVVRNERRQTRENVPFGLVHSLIAERFYPEAHPYRRTTIGSHEDLGRASLDDARAFFRTWYVPNNATLVLAGDFDEAAALAMVRRYFEPIPAGPSPSRARKAVPALTPLRDARLELEAGVPAGRVYLTWPTPPAFAPGDAELDLAASLLGGGDAGRLQRRLVREFGVASDVHVVQDSSQLSSEFEIRVTASKGHDLDEVLAAVDAELDAFARAPVPDEEVARARTRAVAQLIFGVEDLGRRAESVNTYRQLAGDARYFEKDIARYQALTPVALHRAVQRYLVRGERLVSFVRPREGAPVAGALAAPRSTP